MEKKYCIIGLDCPNCAREVENHIKDIKGMKSARVDFVMKRLYVESENEMLLDKEFLNKEVAKVEDGVDVKDIEEKRKIEKASMTKKAKILLLRIALSVIVLATTYILHERLGKLDMVYAIVLYALSYIIVAYDVVIKVIKNVFIKHRFFDENMLMFVATIGAFAIKEFPEGVLVMLLSQIGEVLQEVSVEKSRKAILSTIDLRAETANLIDGEEIRVVQPEELKIGDIVLIKNGEFIPADGVVVIGNGTVDTSSLTGESLPLEISTDSKLLSGMVLVSGSVRVKIEKISNDSTAAKIIELVTNSSQNKAKAEHFISKFASIYTPIVFVLAVIIGGLVPIFTGDWNEYIYRALSFLVISCPCAIIISVPLAYFMGLGMAAKRGVIIKGANYLEQLNTIEKVVFDKTGTLTYGKFYVIMAKYDKITKEKFEEYLSAAESASNHPIAVSILQYFGVHYENEKLQNIKEVAGKGIEVTYKGEQVLAGNSKLMKQHNIDFDAIENDATIIYVAVDGDYKGYVIVGDKIKETSKAFVTALKSRGIKTIMLTGDKENVARNVTKQLDIDDYYAELLPQDKVLKLENEMQNSKGTMYIGDGINDSPSIMRADIGVAMGGVGSDITVQSADIVLMNDDPLKVGEMMEISKKTRRKAITNIVIALSVKTIVLILSAVGVNYMWLAVLADVGLSLFLVFFTMLLQKSKI